MSLVTTFDQIQASIDVLSHNNFDTYYTNAVTTVFTAEPFCAELLLNTLFVFNDS